MGMQVDQIFFKNTLRNFSYLITFNDGVIYCIDPFEADPVLHSLGDKKLSGIINTHDHCDHYSGNEKLVERFSCPVMGHPKAHIPHKTQGLSDKEVIYQSGEWALKTVYTPGHTLTHLCVVLYKNESAYAFFTGDCLFNAGVGNCHSGDPHIQFQTIKDVVGNLPDETLVYPGHEYLKKNLQFTQEYEPNNIAAQNFLGRIEHLNLDEVFFINDMKTEREINTFLRLKSPELKKRLNLEHQEPKKVFLTLRELRNNW
jgi:hydroxyacylglutathione hydrolase